MRTKNTYSFPVPVDSIQGIDSSTSPAHRKWESAEGSVFDDTRAVDFLCPQGTLVLAARAGKVVRVKTGIKKRWDVWSDPPDGFFGEDEMSGNYVMIAHENREFSIYAHLESAEVRAGDPVEEGLFLGRVGLTGWTVKPHLHFAVLKFTAKPPRKDYTTLKVNWLSD